MILFCFRRFASSSSSSTFSQQQQRDAAIQHLRMKFAKFNRPPNHYESLVKRIPAVDKLKRASVLVPISSSSSSDDQTTFYYTLTKRTEMMSSFKGQVCFPGGKQDRSESEMATAYREASEEIGINSNDLVLIAQLTPLITVNHLLVTPVIAHFEKKPDFRPKLSAQEVEFVFNIETSRFLRKQRHKSQEYTNEKGEKYLIHYFTDRVKTMNGDGGSGGDYKPAKTWGFTGFLCALVSSMLHSRLPEFELLSREQPKDLRVEDLDRHLESFLFKRLNH